MKRWSQRKGHDGVGIGIRMKWRCRNRRWRRRRRWSGMADNPATVFIPIMLAPSTASSPFFPHHLIPSPFPLPIHAHRLTWNRMPDQEGDVWCMKGQEEMEWWMVLREPKRRVFPAQSAGGSTGQALVLHSRPLYACCFIFSLIFLYPVPLHGLAFGLSPALIIHYSHSSLGAVG